MGGALYRLLNAREGDLFDRGISMSLGENVRGATAFNGLVTDPPASEEEFRGLWKLYLVCLASVEFDEYGVNQPQSRAALQDELSGAGLVPAGKSLQSILKAVFDYVKRAQRVHGLEAGVRLDPAHRPAFGHHGKASMSPNPRRPHIPMAIAPSIPCCSWWMTHCRAPA